MRSIFFGKYRKLVVVIYIALLISWLFFIFSNSLSNATESTADSDSFIRLLERLSSSLHFEVSFEVETVRTCAHFFEFFVLGLLYYIGTFFFNSNKTSLFFHSLFLSLSTSLVDETLQMGVEGRDAEVTDVLVDFSGALLAHLFILFLYSLFKIIEQKKKP